MQQIPEKRKNRHIQKVTRITLEENEIISKQLNRRRIFIIKGEKMDVTKFNVVTMDKIKFETKKGLK